MTKLIRIGSCWGFSLAGALSVVAAGCAVGKKQQDEKVGTTGLQIAALVTDGTDAASVKYSIQATSCDGGTPNGAPIEETRPIDPDLKLPGNNTQLQNAPLDKNSKHLFADLFKVVPAGCYDVTATPLTDTGAVSQDCAAAHKTGVKVLAGKTTEVSMIAQCKGVDPGALDAIVALNHEPVLEDVVFDDSKFSCGSPFGLCIKASDPDSDPIEIVLPAPAGCEVTPVGDPGCFEVTCHAIAKVDLTAVVYDQLWVNGSKVRIEDWLATEGYPHESHAQLDFHAYVDGIQLWPDTDGDGHGAGTAQILCQGDDQQGLVSNNDDCDDTDKNDYPGNTEVCDGKDNNCDGQVDEGLMCMPQPPPPGTDVVVFNDINPFDNNGMADGNNRLMVKNLVTFTSGKARDSATVVLMDRGRTSRCGGTGECSPGSMSAMYSVITGSGMSITDIASTSGSLTSFASNVKVIFLWNPMVAYTVAEINAFKDFAAEGGRVVFVGEWDGYYGSGIGVENDFLLNMGAVMTNIGQAVDCGYNTLPGTSLRPHEITTGMTDVTIACASVIVPGPGDYPLYYDSTNTKVLAGVATIDTTHVVALSVASAVVITTNNLNASSSSGQ